MESFLFASLLIVLVIRWIYLRDRLAAIDERIDALSSAIYRAPVEAPAATPRPQPQPPAPPSPPPPPPRPAPPPPPPPIVQPQPALPPLPPSIAALDAPSLRERFLEPEEPKPAPIFEPAPTPRRSEDWEALIGGNWLIKIGVFILVVGLAYLLDLAYTRMGPAGRVALSLAASFAMLAAGMIFEDRERYRIFARGLIGGGWAALYTTVYAMHAVAAAKVIESPLIAAELLIAVAIGMIVHSLRYRSQTVTGLAYFIAFVTLAIIGPTALAVIALVPLAASLLYLAHRFTWPRFAWFGLVATYLTCAARGDSGAPLWQAQAIFLIYWLLFEAFDLLHPDPWLLPLNALGFLGLSLLKWQHAAPDQIWQFCAGASVLYLTGTILRAHTSRWKPAVTLNAALAVAAIFLDLHNQTVAFALLALAEAYYLAGLRWHSAYLRNLGTLLFATEVGHLLIAEVAYVPLRTWEPVAALDVLVFYANRYLRPADTFYGYAAAGMAALIAGFESPLQNLGRVWTAMAIAPFALGWWRKLIDFRIQGYALFLLGAGATVYAYPMPVWGIAFSAAVAYAGVLCSLRSAADHFFDDERNLLRVAASIATTLALATILWRVTPGEYLGLAWMALALPILELGLRGWPREFRYQAYALAAIGALRAFYVNLAGLSPEDPQSHRLIPLGVALAAYLFAARARDEEEGHVFDAATVCGTGFLLPAMWALLPVWAVVPAWMAVAILLVEAGLFSKRPILCFQGHAASIAAFGRLWITGFASPFRLPSVAAVTISHYYLWWRTRQRFYLYGAAILALALMHLEMSHTAAVAGWAVFALALLWVGRQLRQDDLEWQSYAIAAFAFARCWAWNFGTPDAMLTSAVVIACLYAAHLLTERGTNERFYLSTLGSLLLAGLLFDQVSGNLLTVAWGLEGIVLLAVGFALRDRVQRLSGLTLFGVCILKLFLWDLRHLDKLPRAISLIVFGLILVAVSWIYSRFRDRLQRYL